VGGFSGDELGVFALGRYRFGQITDYSGVRRRNFIDTVFLVRPRAPFSQPRIGHLSAFSHISNFSSV
jgi:hypothetical protein